MPEDALSPEQQGQPLQIDFDVNSADLRISKDIYVRILQKAVAQTVEDLKEIAAAVQSDDVDTIQKISHRWKGDYDNLRVKALSLVAKDINDLVRDGTMDKEKISEDVRIFSNLFTQVQELVKP